MGFKRVSEHVPRHQSLRRLLLKHLMLYCKTDTSGHSFGSYSPSCVTEPNHLPGTSTSSLYFTILHESSVIRNGPVWVTKHHLQPGRTGLTGLQVGLSWLHRAGRVQGAW